MRARRGRGRRVGRRAAGGHDSPGQGEDVVGVGAGRRGARLGGALAAHHRARAARPQALARRGGARRQRAVRAGRRRRRGAARAPPQAPLPAPAGLEPVHPRGAVSRQVLSVLQRDGQKEPGAGVHAVARHPVRVAALVDGAGGGAGLPRAARRHHVLHAALLQLARQERDPLHRAHFRNR